MANHRSILIAGCLLSALFALVFNLMPVTLGSAAEHFKLEAQQVGLLGSCALGGWVIGSGVAFALARRLSWNNICAIGAVISAAGFFASAGLSDINMAYLCWFIGGLGAGLPFSIAIQALAEVGNQERVMGMKLASEVFLGAALLYLFPVLLIANWQYQGAAIGLGVTMLLGLSVIKHIPASHGSSFKSKSTPEENISPSKVRLTDNLPAIFALIVLAIFFGGQSGVWAFVGIIGTDIGVPAEESGFILAIVKVLGGVAGATAAILGARFGVRWPHIVGLLCIAFGLYLIDGANTKWPYAVGTWIWEFGFALSQCYMMAAVVVLDRSYRMAVLIPAALGIGAALGPAIAGSLKTGDNFTPIFMFATVCALLAAVVIICLMSPRRVQDSPDLYTEAT